MQEFTAILFDTQDNRAIITLNRPDKRNAFSPTLVSELKQAFALAEADPHVKVIVLAANGPAFSAGADLAYLQEMQANSYEENLDDSAGLMALYRQIYLLDKPVIARIQGHAIAGGCGLATVCDFSISVTEAQFGYTEVRIGFVPAIVMVFLLRKVGERNAKELLLTGKLVSAADAQRLGLINTVVDASNLDAEVDFLCAELIGQTSRTALKSTKQMIAMVQEMTLDEALNYAAEMNAQARNTDDCKRGIDHFLNKRKPDWN
jgi:methylglutaconyl-CoA hydratase